MIRHLILPAAACALVFAANARAEAPPIELVETFKNIKSVKPTALAVAPDGTDRLFLVEQGGRILILPEDRAGSEAKVFLDLTDTELLGHPFEEGLLGIAFHPQFKENRKFYVYYTQQNPKRSRVAEMQASAGDPDKADRATERVLLEVRQPYWNHNSGNMAFGPDGFLYICLGDGGKRDDITRLAQNLFVMNGKVLRIDVDGRDGSLPYGIPKDNPFIDKEGCLPEIYAYGLRNPWGIHFEKGTDRFWLADVGQDVYEEVNLIEKGGNYGWSFREGTHKFPIRQDAPPEGAEFIDPIIDYSHADGISITGGVVYHGKANPGLAGYYLYGDWGSGKTWALKLGSDNKVAENTVIYERPTKDFPYKPAAYCLDQNGEILVLSWADKNPGQIYEIRAKK